MKAEKFNQSKFHYRMKRTATRTQQAIAFFVLLGVFFAFGSKPKQAEAIDVSGLGSTIMGCTNIGDTISDFVIGLGRKNGIPGVGKRGNDTGIEKMVAVHDQTLSDKVTTQTEIDQRNEQTIKCLNGIAWTASKIALANITQKTVNWANTGLSGNPLYVNDPGAYWDQIKERELNSFITDLNSAGNAFGNEIAKELINGNQDKKLSELRSDQRKKTGYDSTQFEQDFNNGGWAGWINYNLNSANNPLGSRFVAQRRLSTQQATSVNNAQDELLWNNGFLSIKKCADNKGPAPVATADSSGPGAATPYVKKTCRTFETQTPGIIIQNQLSQALGVPANILTNADQINETLGAVFDSLANNLFNKGLKDLGKAQQDAGYGMGSTAGILQGDIYGGSNANPFDNTSVATGSLYNYSTSWFGVNGDFDIRDMKQFDLIIKTQHDYIDAMTLSLPQLDKIIGPIAKLDMCIPGPNAIWSEEVGQKIQALYDQIVSASFDGKTPDEIVRNPLIAQLQNNVLGGTIGGLADLICGIFCHRTPAEKIADTNLQNQINFEAKSFEFQNNDARFAQGLLLSYTDYGARVKQAYPNDSNHLLPVADEANPIVANLRNYDTNITDLKDLYFQRKQDTLLVISRLNDLQGKIRPIVVTARQKAMRWNLQYCPQIAPNPGDIGVNPNFDPALDTSGAGGIGTTDAGGGVISTGPGGAVGTGGGTTTGNGTAGAGTGGN